jgi:uncharacterized protein (DUF697 family)
MATKIGFSQFFKTNTPKAAQIVGDISLVLAFVSSVPILLATAGITVPAAIITASVYATTGGSLVKIFSKYFGIEVEGVKPKENEQ